VLQEAKEEEKARVCTQEKERYKVRTEQKRKNGCVGEIKGESKEVDQ